MLNFALLADIAGVLGPIWNVILVALGLGLVIFFHELGHFAVAKWCDVQVERFSIGFGPILWSRQRGETEYALSAIPFGGYVKMLGQDDMDASQMADENIAQNPRSYSAKKVWQRMAIISAGVIMNIITAFLFFTIAYGFGVMDAPPKVGSVKAGSPAWEQGIGMGDEITHINGEEMATFSDISMEIALSDGPLKIKGRHPDGSTFEKTVIPDSGRVRTIGVVNTLSLELITPLEEKDPVTVPGLPAAKADPPFLPGDRVVSINGIELTDFSHMKRVLYQSTEKPAEFRLQRRDKEDGTPGDLVTTTVQAAEFRSFGFSMEMGPIASVMAGSVADQEDLMVGDTILSVNDRKVGEDLDPMQLNVHLASLAEKNTDVQIVVRRKVEGSGDKDVSVKLKPSNLPWSSLPRSLDEPWPAPSIGLAYHVSTRIARVFPDSEAAKAGIEAGQKIVKVELVKTNSTPDASTKENEVIDLEPKEDEELDVVNWAVAYATAQRVPTRKIILHVRTGDKTVAKSLTEFESEKDFYMPLRGFHTMQLEAEQQASGFGDALAMGARRTWKNILQIYLTLKSLITGRISAKELHGPVGIARVGYQVASRGISSLLLFLGFLSVNLAVLNFLPIPVLDGGHMVFLIYEAVAGKKPSEKILVAAQYAGLLFILGLMGFVLWQDFARLIPS